MFGGVAALLADRLDLDALWVRIGFVLLALVGGIGLVVYGALWLALVVGADPDRRWARIAGGVLLVVGLPLLLTDEFQFFDGPFAVLALLAGLAVALWQPRRPPEAVTAEAVTRPVAQTPGGAVAPPDEVVVEADGSSRWRGRLPQLPRRAPRPPSILGRATLGVAVLVAAIGALVDQANGGRMHPEQWLGAAAAVCGIGLLVGAVAGRALWLVVPAVAFGGVGLVAGESARLGIRPDALIGDESVVVRADQPGGWSEREHVVLGAVDVTVEGAPLAPVEVDARAAIGNVDVWVAHDVTVQVRARVDHGDVEVQGVDRLNGTYTLGPEGPPDVVVTARVGRGEIHLNPYERTPAVPREPVIVPSPAERFVADGVMLARGGQFVLAGGEAVIGADDDVLSGSAMRRDRVMVISTSMGEFRLLPGGLLLTPSGELLDLHALRGDTDTTVPTAPTTAPSATTVPAVPPPAPAGSVPAVGDLPTPTTATPGT